MPSGAWGALALGAALLGGCARIVPAPEPARPRPPIATPSAPAPVAAFSPGPAIASLGLGHGDALGALRSFRESCPALLRRSDQTGLTRTEDWRAVCAAAGNWSDTDPAGFFAANFETVRLSDGRAFATGYFEPEIAGSRQRIAGYDVPVYAMPPDLVRGWPEETPADQRTGRAPLGRTDASGAFIPYYERAEIEAGALANRGLEIAWAADPVEFFFLQIQGSGRLRAPDGSMMRIGYAGQNGRDYVAIGRVLREAGTLQPGQATMQGIVAYLSAQPDRGRSIMQRNPSYVFFRELEGEGAIGALGVPVRARASVAADPAFVPLGAPVWLRAEPGATASVEGLWIAQDTGGAIRGANRFDTFWGAGAEAARIAGGMSARGDALMLLPKVSVARLTAPD